jgi:chromosomal replication initiator protein
VLNVDLVKLRDRLAENATAPEKALISQFELKENNDELLIICPSSFVQQHVKRHYQDIISKSVMTQTGKPVNIVYSVSAETKALPSPKAGPVQMMLPSPGMLCSTFGINPRFTFDSFVVGKCNSFAYEVAVAVSEDGIGRYNPVYFNSDIGLGKSHIAHSIGNRMIRTRPNSKIKFTSAREFSQEYVFASRNGCLDKFRQAYRGGKTDIFFLDDVHMLCSKEKTQMELSGIIDDMTHAGAQVIFSGYRPPSTIHNLDKSLKSRFEGGLVIDIKRPDAQTRASIVRSKGTREGVILTDDVVDFISENIDTNIRELESVVLTLCAMSTFMKRGLSIELAKEILEGTLERKSRIDIPFLLEFVAKHFGTTKESLISPSRKKPLAYPRQVAMYFCRRYTKETLQEIGNAFNRKHTSVMHSIEVMESEYQNNLKTKKEIDFLSERLDN